LAGTRKLNLVDHFIFGKSLVESSLLLSDHPSRTNRTPPTYWMWRTPWGSESVFQQPSRTRLSNLKCNCGAAGCLWKYPWFLLMWTLAKPRRGCGLPTLPSNVLEDTSNLTRTGHVIVVVVSDISHDIEQHASSKCRWRRGETKHKVRRVHIITCTLNAHTWVSFRLMDSLICCYYR